MTRRLKTLWAPNAASPSDRPGRKILSNPRPKSPLRKVRSGRKTYFAGWIV